MFACAAFGFWGCDNYLKDDSGDLLVPKSVNEYIPLLYGEGYPRTFNSDVDFYAIITDDIQTGTMEWDPESPWGTPNAGYDSDVAYAKWAYTWDYQMSANISDKNWAARYANILGCNTIIAALDNMSYEESESGKFNNLAAQAYTLRAYHYFCLVNSYALPWSAENLNEPGVVLRLSPEVMVDPIPRSTVGEVYKQINEDIIRAKGHMALADPSTNKHLISPDALLLLSTRISLFQEKWDEVIADGEEFLRGNGSILNLNTVSDRLAYESENPFYMMSLEENPEIVFTFGTKPGVYPYAYMSSSGYEIGIRVSYEDEGSLIQTYEESDIRVKAYFVEDFYYPGNPYWGIPGYYEYQYYMPRKCDNTIYDTYRENWRTVEVLLNAAEAYARKDQAVSRGAIDLINRLRVNRHYSGQYTALDVADFTNRDALIKFIWDERRRELCFEEAMRYWDLKRQGMPRIEHKFWTTTTTYETYVLKEGSPNYVMPIPGSETEYNNAIVVNPREVINPS